MLLLFSCSADTFRSCRFCFAANSADRTGARRQPEPREEDSVSDGWFSAEEEVPSRQSCRQRIEPGPTWGSGLAAYVLPGCPPPGMTARFLWRIILRL
jgi:hypothetical protein